MAKSDQIGTSMLGAETSAASAMAAPVQVAQTPSGEGIKAAKWFTIGFLFFISLLSVAGIGVMVLVMLYILKGALS